MKFGIAIRNMGPQSTKTTIKDCALAAERLGYDALFVSDHLCIPPDQTEGSGGRYLDVLATLAFVAGGTERIRLGISVLVLPYRPAVFTAKLIATIQELSAERMILGVGSGWMRPEFDALGVDFKRRGAITTETLRVIRHLFAHEAQPYHGQLLSFPAFVFKPRPKCPPIWIGGNGANAIARVIEFGDGWHPMLRAGELKATVAEVKSAAATKGKPDLEIVARSGFPLDDMAKARERLDGYKDAGVTYVILDLGRYADSAQFIGEAEKFITEVVR
ncbi:MAG TPA: TIGR03619 family F420-dependent LLM class oxidoreductase [Candidatus Binataceae bacterium]|jgi:probable F420-dependent oxidoreductase|nr:TIGR03619 family F420-dependent LLM class oxidoreductase [Candidatus Binataceae bacterium]